MSPTAIVSSARAVSWPSVGRADGPAMRARATNEKSNSAAAVRQASTSLSISPKSRTTLAGSNAIASLLKCVLCQLHHDRSADADQYDRHDPAQHRARNGVRDPGACPSADRQADRDQQAELNIQH